MSEDVDTTKPDRPRSGASLIKDSTSGRKSQFVLQTGTATASFTISAGTVHTLAFNLGLWNSDIPTADRDATNIIDFAYAAAWVYENMYIDNDNDGDYYYPNGASLSAGQQDLVVEKLNASTPNYYSAPTLYTATTFYKITNNDASDHTIYYYGRYKYIIFGDTNL